MAGILSLPNKRLPIQPLRRNAQGLADGDDLPDVWALAVEDIPDGPELKAGIVG